MLSTIGLYAREFLNLVYPPHCHGCGEPLAGEGNPILCESCYGQIAFLGREVCSRCGNETGPFAEKDGCPMCASRSFPFRAARSIAKYEEPLREIIHSYKFGKREFLAKFLSMLVVDNLSATDVDMSRYHLIVPVPLHRKRRRERGFDQIMPVAAALSERFGVSLAAGLLVRHRYTTSQVRLSRAKRLQNLKDAFSIRDGADLGGRRLLLVDDIITTGATVSECARVLRRGGAASVDVLTIAR